MTYARKASLFRLALLALFTVSIAACSDGAASVRPTDSSSAILGGDVTNAYPAIGELTVNGEGCTATLITPNVLLSAAHCVGYGTANPGSGSYGSFAIFDTNGAWVGSFTVDGYKAFTKNAPSVDDISLVHLANSVPADQATPIPLASTYPSHGTWITMYGYGCTDRNTHAGTWTKRSHSYTYGDGPDRLCPGDSGGPHLNPAGQAMRVNSGYGAYDTYADTVRHYWDLTGTIATWPSSPAVAPRLSTLTSASYDYHLEVNRPLIVWGSYFAAGANSVTITQGSRTWNLPGDDSRYWWNGGSNQINTVLPSDLAPTQGFTVVVGGPGGTSNTYSSWASCAAGATQNGSVCSGP